MTNKEKREIFKAGYILGAKDFGAKTFIPISPGLTYQESLDRIASTAALEVYPKEKIRTRREITKNGFHWYLTENKTLHAVNEQTGEGNPFTVGNHTPTWVLEILIDLRKNPYREVEVDE